MADATVTPRRSAFQRFLAAIEPWYDWGTINTVNMDARTHDDQVDGEVRFFEIQWFGLHFGVQFGRTPRNGGGR